MSSTPGTGNEPRSTDSMTAHTAGFEARTKGYEGRTLTAAGTCLRTYSSDSRRIEAQRRAASDPNRRLPMPR